MAKERTLKITDKGKGSRSDYPTADKIGSRSSTVARAMASTLMPRIGATDEERKAILQLSLNNDEIGEYQTTDSNTIKKNQKEVKKKKETILRYNDNNNEAVITKSLGQLKCVYCGATATNLDHLFPFITAKQPTGYFTDPANLVPCCGDCNQKKGTKLWHEYMDEIINSLSDNKKEKEDYKERKKRLNEYCHEKHLPDENKTIIDKQGNPVNNDHALNIMMSFKDDELKLTFKEWWDGIYKEIINALDDAQIRIDAFKAGIKYSIKSNTTGVDDCFKHYFKELVQNETNELYANPDNNNLSIDDILKKEDKDDQGDSNSRKKYYRLLEHGFRLNDDGRDLSASAVVQPLYEKAQTAFKLGFNYAKTEDNSILKSCIDKGWLEDVKVSENF